MLTVFFVHGGKKHTGSPYYEPLYISQKFYTTYMPRHLLFKVYVTIIQSNTVLSSVVTMIMHIVRCTPGDLWTAGLVCDRMFMEYTHTHEEHCNMLLTLVLVRVKQIPLHRSVRYIILVLILTLMYLEQSLHDTLTQVGNVDCPWTVQAPAIEDKSSSMKLGP
jgi:hypothetical protein